MKQIKTMKILIFIYLLSCLKGIDGYAAGGPSLKNICTSMTPGHGEDPQSTSHKYKVLVEAAEIKGGEPIDITISSPDDDPFKGFYIQGRKVGSEEAVGTFSADSNEIKLLDCFNLPNSSATHTNPGQKTVVNLKWTPPYEEGNYVILATFVKDSSTYWVKIPSKFLTVKRNTAIHSLNPGKVNQEEKNLKVVKDKLLTIYNTCGKSIENDGHFAKGCFGTPENCVENFQNDPNGDPCEIMTSYKVEGEKYIFEIVGKSNGYVANGLSFDTKMGDDSVVICRLSENGTKKIYPAYNQGYDHEPHKNESFGLLNRGTEKFESIDGFIYCSFTRSQFADLSDVMKKKFDLNEPFHILLAKGSVKDNGISRHSIRDVSDKPINLIKMEPTINKTSDILVNGYRVNMNHGKSGRLNPTDEVHMISKAVRDKLASSYKTCGKDGDNDEDKIKGCFGIPQNCVENFQNNPNSNPCDIFTSYRVDDEKYIFEIFGKSKGYVANGLSFDSKMGDDSVVICRLSENGTKKIYPAYNQGYDHEPHKNESFGLLNRGTEKFESIDGFIYCSFTRSQFADLSDVMKKKFDLNETYHILLAEGTVTPSEISKHAQKGVSGELRLADTSTAKAKSDIMVELHGSIMMIAWLLCASSGTFTARYYKHTHTGFTPFGKAFWFVVHLIFMFSTVILTITGCITIFVKKDMKWSKESGSDGHPVIGVIVTGLAIIQVLIAFIRPGPGDSKRKLFNWVHWTIGNSAHILAIVTIFLSVNLSSTGLENNQKSKNNFLYVLSGFVAFHCLFHIIMSIHTVMSDKKMGTIDKKRGFRPGPIKPSGLEASEEASGTWFRTLLLAVYILGSAGVAVGLIYIVCTVNNK